MKTKSIFLTLIALGILTSALNGQIFNKSREDSLLNLLEKNNKSMGSMAILKNGNVIYTKAIGFINSDPKTPSNEKTKYRIGSITKMFTATLIFQLIDEGKLTLTTTLDKFYPTVPNAGKITIANMLGHRSGIHSFTDDPAYLTWMFVAKTRREMISIISEGNSEFEPGSKTKYSNSNFVLLGFIVEDVRKEHYNNILQKHICSKAGLGDTYYGGKTNPAKNESYSFKFLKAWEKQPETDLSIPHGAGAIVSTPSDLVKFISILFSGKLVSEKSLGDMKTVTDGLGMGMIQFPYENKKLYGHGGSIDGFTSMLGYFPDEKLALCYISNGSIYSVNDVLLRTLNIYFDKPEKLPQFTSYELKPGELDQYLGVYSSPQLPLKLTLTKNDGKLFGQGTGQPAFPLDASEKDVFKFETAGIVIRFTSGKEEFVLEQGGGKFTFTKEN